LRWGGGWAVIARGWPGYGPCMDAATHHIETTRTHNDNPDVPDALHLRCTCGWTAATHDEATAEQIAREHLRVGVPAPTPASPSPN
jgi:hypothetical protein